MLQQYALYLSHIITRQREHFWLKTHHGRGNAELGEDAHIQVFPVQPFPDAPFQVSADGGVQGAVAVFLEHQECLGMELLQVQHDHGVHVAQLFVHHVHDPEQLFYGVTGFADDDAFLFLDYFQVPPDGMHYHIVLIYKMCIQGFFGNAHTGGNIVHGNGPGAVLPEQAKGGI